MNKSLLILFFVLAIIGSVTAQEGLPKKTVTIKYTDIENDKSKLLDFRSVKDSIAYYIKKEPKNAQKLLLEHRKLPEKIEEPEIICEYYCLLASYYVRQGEKDSATIACTNAISFLNKHADGLTPGLYEKTLQNLLKIQVDINDDGKVIDYLLQLQKLHKPFKEIGAELSFQFFMYNNLHELYIRLKQLDKAAEYATTAVSIAQKINKSKVLSFAYRSMGSVLRLQNKCTQSITYLDSSLMVLNKSTVPLTSYKAALYGEYANTYRKMLLPDSGIKYARLQFEANNEIGQKDLHFSAAQELMANFALKKKSDSVIYWAAYLEKNLNYNSPSTYNVARIWSIANSLYKVGKFEEASERYQLALKMQDTLSRIEKKNELDKLSFLYDVNKKDKDLAHQTLVIKEKEIETLEYQKQLQIEQLRFEYEKKQAAAKSEQERQKLLYEENIKKEQIENIFNQNKIALEEKQKNTELKAKAEEENHLRKLNQQKQNTFFVFGSAVALLSIFLIYLFYRFRINQLKKIIATRKKIASDLHDDLGGTLNSIKLYSHLAATENKPEHIERIKENTKEAVAGLKDLIWTLDDDKNTTKDLIEKINSFALPAFAANNIQFICECSLPCKNVKLEKEEKRNLYLIVKEAITNTVKHAEANKATVEINCKSEKLIITYTDGGKGFVFSNTTNGNGLKNIKERAKTIGYDCNYVEENKLVNGFILTKK
jgi:signal transduction histidine kinase